MEKKVKWYNKAWVKILVIVVIVAIVVTSSVVYYIWLSAIAIGRGSSPAISATIEKDNNNWTCLITAPSRADLSINASTFVIKRGDLTLVSFTFDDKQVGDPTNIDPLTGNITDYDVYTLTEKGYTIYFYDTYKGVLTGGDIIYIVNNGLRSGDTFRILWKGEPCTLEKILP